MKASGLVGLSAALWLAATAVAQTPEVLGTWRGTSTCVDREHFPACHDEQVIYEIRPHASARDSVVVAADKVVNGARDPMGELTFGRAANGTWAGEFANRRGRSRWTLRIAGHRMTGELVDVATARQVRALLLTRDH